MVDAKHKWRVQDAYASDDLCVGGDHRTVNAVLNQKKRENNNNKRTIKDVATRQNFKSWQPQNGKEYAALLDKYITEEYKKTDWQTKDNSEKIEAIENTIMKVAMSCEKPKAKNIELPKISDTMLRTALAGRNWYRKQHKYKEASIMARASQRLAKKLQREKVRINVNRIVEDFK